MDIDKLEKVPNDFWGLKTKVDTLDIGKPETIPVVFSNPSDEVINNAVKKTEHDELA